MKRRPLIYIAIVDLFTKTETACGDRIKTITKATKILPGLPGGTAVPSWRQAGLFCLMLLFIFVFNGMAAEALAAARTVGGDVTGLAGTGLVLQNNDGDDLAVDANGAFAFDTGVEDGQAYQVAAAVQPAYPDQWCNVYNASGTVSGADVSDIEVVCVTGLYNVVDTNQVACYLSASGAETTCTGTGYDADYAGAASDYTVSADGDYVTDNVTGLIWTQTPDLDGSGSVDIDDKRTWSEAVGYCSTLDMGGFDWRLPTIKELYSLIDFRGGDPSSYNGTDTSILTPFIDDAVFEPGYGDTDENERLIDGQYATTTIYVSPEGVMDGSAAMFGVNFVDGRIKGYSYDFPPDNPKTFYVHCVAGNELYGVNEFVDNQDGTVSDLAAGLMWEQDDYESSGFEDAVSHCEGAATGGHSDWRLPDIKELQSIVDYSRAPDLDPSTAAIDPVFNATAITNEGGADDWGFYWSSTTHADYLGNGRTADYIAFGRALGYYKDPETQTYSLVDVHGAGAQRSVSKTTESSPGAESADVGYGTFYYKGPQGDIQRIDNMVFCVRDDDANRSPEMTTNAGLSVSEGQTDAIIENTVLDANDADNGPGELTYTVESPPQNGVLQLDDADLAMDDSFTQAQIDAGSLSYSHDGSETESDSFGFSVEDPSGDGVSGQTFAITVIPVNDPPTVDVNLGLAVKQGDTETVIANTELSACDPDHSADELTYTVTTLSQDGNLLRDGVVLELNDTFTQADIDGGLLSFDIDGSTSESASFGFDLADAGAPPLSVTGQTFLVTILSPIVVNTANDDETAGDGLCTLREAIGNANADADATSGDCSAGQGADEITFAGDYAITLTGGELSIEDDLSIVGTGADNLTISGNNASRVFNVSADVTASISDLTIANGFAGDGADGQIGETGGSGGGIYNSGTLTVTNSALYSNNAGDGGESFSGNGAAGGSGGGIYSDGTLTVTNCAIYDNWAGKGGLSSDKGGRGGSGGGIYSSGTLTVTNGDLNGNNAGDGGQSYTSNGAAGGSGGGIYNSGTLTVANSAISDNNAGNGNSGIFAGGTGGSGGGIYNSGTLAVENSALSGNNAGNGKKGLSSGGAGGPGGGIYSNGTLSVTNSTLSGNNAGEGGACDQNEGAAGGSGGGIYNGAEMTATNSTLAGNAAGTGGNANSPVYDDGADGSGGAIYNNGTLHLENSILADSVLGDDCYNAGGDAIDTNANNLIETNASFGNMCGTPAYSTDPRLEGLADNGGFTETMAISADSPAIDAGDDAICAADPVNNLDQRGFARPQGTHCDIGAYEALMTVTAVDSDPNPSAYGETATFTATVTGPYDTPTGTVDFSEGGTSLCSDVSLSDGQAECENDALTVGSHTVAAVYSGDAAYFGSSGSVEHAVDKADQAIVFGALSDKVSGDADFTVSATADSGLTVSFASDTPSICTASDDTVSLAAPGVCTITASQAGNENYNAAADASRSFNVKARVTPSVGVGAKGAIDPDADQGVLLGDTADFAIVPSSGYLVDTPVGGTCGGSYAGDPEDAVDGIVFTTDPVAADCTVEPSFSLALAEMDVRGNGQSIDDGDDSPSADDHTDFGTTFHTCGSVDRTFTIASDGNAKLALDGDVLVALNGEHASDFSVTSEPSPSVAGGATTTFTVRFVPGGTGLRTATVSIDSNDGDENPYDFSIQGTGEDYEAVYVGTNGCDGLAPCFETVQEAVNAAFTGKPVKIAAGSFDETDVVVDREGETVSISGGYDEFYDSNDETSAIYSLTIESGTVVVENLVLGDDGSGEAFKIHAETTEADTETYRPLVVDSYAEADLYHCLESDSKTTPATRELLGFVLDHASVVDVSALSAEDISEESRERLETLIQRFYLTALDNFPAPPARDVLENLYLQKTEDEPATYRFIALGTGETLFLSQEYEEKALSEKEFVIDCYLAFLGRTPDEWELSAWLSLDLAREEFLSTIAGSEEFSDAVAE